jgi:hypothetical protein
MRRCIARPPSKVPMNNPGAPARHTLVLINSDVTGALRVAVLTSIPVHARAFGALLDSRGLIQEPGGVSA